MIITFGLLTLLLGIRVDSAALGYASPAIEFSGPEDDKRSNGSEFVQCSPRNQRIVGGTAAFHGEIPWQVSISREGAHFCGGSLIHRQWVLSAAHCFKPQVAGGIEFSFPLTSTYVTLGEYRRDRVDGTEQVVPLVDAIRHPYYEPNGDPADGGLARNDHDIILLKLRYPVLLSDYVRIASIPDPLETFNRTCCTVSGWGVTSYGGIEGSRTLKKLTIPVVDSRECAKLHRPGRIKDFHICAGYLNVEGLDACQGDSGGPLTCRKDGVNYVAGIISWGLRCAYGDAYSVYTRVSRYKSWIEEVIATK